MAYKIDISEKQREVIQRALIDALDRDAAGGVYFDPDEREEVELLYKMVEELPEVEKKYPGVLHGSAL